MLNFLKFEAARINRIEYLSLGLFMQAVMIAVIFITVLIGRSSTLLVGLLFIFTLMWYVFTIAYGILLGIKRLHDLNRSGWTMLLLFVPIFNIAWAIYMLCASGTKGKNRFGEQPQPAALSHKIVLFVCLFVLVISIVISIVGIGIFGGDTQSTGKSLHAETFNWKVCNTRNYTIKFPGDYTVTKKNIDDGVLLVARSYTNSVEDIKLEVDEIDYSKAPLNSPCRNFFNGSLVASPERTIKVVMAIKGDVQDIKVSLDKSLHQQNVLGRELQAAIKFSNNNVSYIKGRLYLDKPHHMYYMLRVYSRRDLLQDNNGNTAKQFLNSFKLEC